MARAETATLEELRRRENRKVAGWLLYYQERKAEYERLRQEIEERMPAGVMAVPDQKGNVLDPTGRKAEQLLKLKEYEDWLRLVEDVESRLPPRLQLILRLRREARHRRGYSRGRPAWIAYAQHRYCKEVAEREGRLVEEVWVNSPDTFSGWWNKIVEYAAREAAKRGLLVE